MKYADQALAHYGIKTAGYTHYFPHNRDFTSSEWGKVVSAARRIVQAAEKQGISIVNGVGDPGTKPEIGSKEIWLNGEGDEGHETFHLMRGNPGRFEFCKTARKPYDAVVVSILAVAAKVAPGALDLDSDGGMGALKKVLGSYGDDVLTHYGISAEED